MKLINSHKASQRLRDEAWSLLQSSFPLAEQRPLEYHLDALADPAFHADIITLDEEFVGLVFYWIVEPDFCFVEHFAVAVHLRGQKIGERALKMVTSKAALTILEVDPPEDEISIRRVKFYQRQGFFINHYLHIHPSYRPTTPAHELSIMSFPREITESEFQLFTCYSMTHVLKYARRSDV